jgi:hypothetical protein
LSPTKTGSPILTYKSRVEPNEKYRPAPYANLSDL